MGNRTAIGATTQDDETLNGPLMGESSNAYGRSPLVRMKKHLVSHLYRSIGIGEYRMSDAPEQCHRSNWEGHRPRWWTRPQHISATP